MIEAGTPDEIKESILGNMTWRPDLDLLKKTRKAFEAQEFEVAVVTTKTYETSGKRSNAYSQWPVISVSFTSKRSLEGAMSKTLRAVRSLRLSMFQFTNNGKAKDGSYAYVVELRERE
jgi:hypothetical protein